MMRHASTLTLAICALGLGACVKSDKKPAAEEDVPAHPMDSQPIEAQRSAAVALVVTPELRTDGLLLHIGGIPADAALECTLDEAKIDPCHDGALYARPAPGDHRMSVTARVAGVPAAYGQSEVFTVLPGAAATIDAGDKGNTLMLVQADPSFVNGAALPISKDFVARFQFAKKPACQAELRCQYDSVTSPFWTECDPGGESFTIPKALLASGLQFVSAQASCGEEIGPVLKVFFYGVPDGYQPLMLSTVKDDGGRHIANLVKADDCPEISQQRFECAEEGDDVFALCLNGNVVDKPSSGYRIRLVCDGRQGPPLTLAP